MTTVLQGIRVLDLSRVFAGPAATQILGDLGADVIKVEEPGRGDEARYFGVTRDSLARSDGVSPSFVALNRNKRSIAIDLGAPAGRDAVRRMAAHCDIVVHNFRPGAMQRWGLDYTALCAINPRIIYGDFYAYGKQGSLSHIGANDLALQAHSGLMSLTGEPDRPPVRCGSSIGEAADHEQLASIGGIVEFEMDGKRVKAVASPFALEGTPLVVDRSPPGLAAHTDEILAELGFADADVAALHADGAFGSSAKGT